MLGGAYGKAKDKFTGSTFFKLLGLGALIFAFNKYKDEIIAAMAGILEYFSDVYGVFKSEGIGAAFDKVLDDFKNVFFPKVEGVVMSMLDTLWSTVKEVAMSWLFGASGEKRIVQEAGTGSTATSNMARVVSETSVKDIDTSVLFGTAKHGEDPLSREQRSAVSKAYQDKLRSMLEISDQSDGRIQWTGINRDMSTLLTAFTGWDHMTGFFERLLPSEVMNANPIIDGHIFPNWDVLKTLKPGDLAKAGGMTNLMTEDKQEEITKILAEKSVLANEYAAVENSEYGDMGFFSKLVRNPADFDRLKSNRLLKIQKEINAQDLLLSRSGAGELQVRDYTDSSSAAVLSSSGNTQSTKSLNGMKITGTDRTSSPSADFNSTTVVDNKKIIDAKEVHNHPMNPGNINVTALQLAKYNNMLATSGI